VAVLTGDQVIQILDQTVDWYRTLGTQQQTASQPSDLLILYANQQTAAQVVGLAFDIARANAELLSSEASSAQSATDNAASSSQVLVAEQKKLQAQHLTIQSEMDGVRRQIAASAAGSKPDLDSKLSELQGELDMLDARKNLLDTMAQFVMLQPPPARAPPPRRRPCLPTAPPPRRVAASGNWRPTCSSCRTKSAPSRRSTAIRLRSRKPSSRFAARRSGSSSR
jgi:hypothetical protein